MRRRAASRPQPPLRLPKKAKGDETVLAIVASVIHHGQCRSCEHLPGPGQVQPSGFKYRRTLRSIELYPHIYVTTLIRNVKPDVSSSRAVSGLTGPGRTGAVTAAPACEPGQEAAAPLCPEGAEAPRGCHEMSCSVMRCHVPPRRARFRRRRRSAVRLHPACPSSIAFRSVRAAAGLPAARPFFARIACVCARSRRRGLRA